ncbi:MAG: hypothetical protein A2W90_11665 [Bacteroidetes bacterium GWF2_42_66]|nr:MAG: hypothetical protein A2W92_00395 [Bacteroidetes bacterium GWA2_42_15]OFY01772.1 MAG: hypothetical protein A2W89_22905 [Bacteroidetes bacterium GWE2_42_39]OFY44936.1 MAG: hypothetical protein A2W90_11665 [Bacteroidetes bacterium GWF2_42_66]HBL76066.1 thioesterase [Prolixibacteraceae bacterium]HCR90217.1 thioesterase [Prolixibacteraceae bacterium]
MDYPKLSIDTPIGLINQFAKNTLVDTLGIIFTEVGVDFVKATMPVDQRTFRPGGMLHGGASIALAESVAGLGSMLLVDMNKYDSRGIQISANHTGSISEGMVFATAKIVHAGNQTHVWDVRIEDKNGRLISVERVTNMIIERNGK